MQLRSAVAFSFGLLLIVLFAAGSLYAAAVKPLEVFSEKILVREIEYFATEHILNSAQLRESVDRLNREMNIISIATAGESLKLLTDVAEKLSAAEKSSATLSRYLLANSASLKSAGHGRYLPLAGMDKEIEGDYFRALASFLQTAFVFVTYCHDNFDAVGSGKEEERRHYEVLYAAYLKDMERFNTQSIRRSQLLAEMGSDHASLMELMPR